MMTHRAVCPCQTTVQCLRHLDPTVGLGDDEIVSKVAAVVEFEREVACRELRRLVNQARRELGMPTVVDPAQFRDLARRIQEAVRGINVSMARFAAALRSGR